MKAFILFVLIAPGLACLYAIVLRPILHKITGFQKFYDQADGFWTKVWAFSGKSITLIWSYLLAGLGSALALVDPLAAMLGDPDFKNQITNALQSNPKYVGYFAIGVSVITLLARMRSLTKTS